ncbi:hypothetical protein CAC42_6084 [Sphaceloma murrayae]|uniref:CoA-binding domain-containing protein n=1 Tax=Sphaceloma murrayae TaxID=2082308 RepID=A0A2K1QVF3_9PEZI|nr:hypothetical protein CAC42_6084 [Sphaceloma murrayae]
MLSRWPAGRAAAAARRHVRYLTSSVEARADATLAHLRIGKHTRVLYQGFTGRVASQNAKDSIEWGTNVVGGVKPGTEGEHLGLPIVPSVRVAKEKLKPDATAIFVPMTGAAKAIEEAIEAEIPLIVAVAEHIPVHDMVRVLEMLRTTGKSRLVGANSPGIIAPLGHCRIGFQPLPIYQPGHVGVVAKSGTLSYEAVGSLTRAGLGQSLCIGAGGDVACGTTLLDGFKVLSQDPDTHAIVVVGEVGGTAEEALATAITDYRASTTNPKPIVALVAGRTAPIDRIMGHAGAFVGPVDRNAQQKYERLEAVGTVMVDHPEQFGPVVKTLLEARRSMTQIKTTSPVRRTKKSNTQIRSFHTSVRPRVQPTQLQQSQARRLHLQGQAAVKVLGKEVPGINIIHDESINEPSIEVGITMQRILGRPSAFFRPSYTASGGSSVSFDLSTGITDEIWTAISKEYASFKPLDPSFPGFESFQNDLRKIYTALAAFHKSHEAISVSGSLIPANVKPDSSSTVLANPVIHLDDAAFKSANRQTDLFALRDKSLQDQAEVEAEDHGIVYITLHPDDPSASIGTLVNGAGLAMNTVDVLQLPPFRSRCANFLDTGGKATSETVKKSFELILRDQRVKVIFVNIFGGLTDCGMIADGVVLAFKEVEMRGVPVVVRLRGTNEEVGQRKIAESGLSLEAFDGFEEAALRVVELAGQGATEGVVGEEAGDV